MRLSEQLKNELREPVAGVRAPYYFRYLGYREDLAAVPAKARANAAWSLFANTKPKIFIHDLIVGNDRGLWCEADETTLDYAKKIDERFGRRGFLTNWDHYSPDYEHVVTVGIQGLQKEIQESLKKHGENPEKCETLRSMNRTLEGFQQRILHYAQEAARLKTDAGYDAGRLDFIEKNCLALLEHAPTTFAEALQLVWLCHTAFGMEERAAMALGRMDQYLYPFYQKDVENGILNRERAIELLENIYMKILDSGTINICIGGMDIHGNCQVNDLSYCILYAVRNCNIPGPNLSARITPNTPDEFLDECLKVIGTGLGYPALMNDCVNMEALRAYGYEEEDIYNYSMVGCIENFITGKQPPWSDGRFDAPRYLDYVFHNGVSAVNGSVGLDLGDVEEIRTMEEFVERYEQQLAYGVKEYCALFRGKNESINQAFFPDPFLSCFCWDCIGRGLDVNNGGSRYPSIHGAALMGVGTVSDSLAALEKVVFVDREATLTEVKRALQANFEGYEELRQKLLAAPKYGNNDDFVDKYAVWYLDFMSSEFAKYKTRDGGGIYVAMAANISNIHAGAIIAATPDGRLKGEPLSDAASPTYGRDRGGATVTINSVTKPDYKKAACGTVINQKFSPSMFRDGKRQKLLALIKTYFKKGGQEMQINATSPEVLRDAMVHPEQYQDLVVRVSGFSAFYVTLEPEVQLDILNRTQQE